MGQFLLKQSSTVKKFENKSTYQNRQMSDIQIKLNHRKSFKNNCLIIGLGFVGLTLAVFLARRRLEVYGIDKEHSGK